MKKRIFSGAVIVLLLIAVIIFNKIFPLALHIVISLSSLICVFELAKAVGVSKKPILLFPSLIAAAIIPFSVFVAHGSLVVFSIYTLLMFLGLIAYHKDIELHEFGMIYAMTILISSGLQTIILMRSLNDNHGIFYAMIPLLAAWGPDVGAYFVGVLFGKHKLCPEISPKKTVEGFFGGILFGMIAMIVVGLYFKYIYYGGQKSADYLVLAIIGAGSALTSVIGDLSFSIIKRKYGIKDFGTVIPGHGGILDRFDSVIFTAPYVYLIVSMMPLVV